MTDHYPDSKQNSAPRLWRRARLSRSLALIVLFALALGGGMAAPAVGAVPPPPLLPDAAADEAQMLEDVEHQYQASYLRLATGNPLAVPAWKAGETIPTMEGGLATHATYAWPFDVAFTVGHAIQSYQNYYSGTSDAYFHHGIDIMAPNGAHVFNRSGGQVVNVENYQPGNDLYWEVAVLDPEGYIWQYHHIDKNTIPQAIKNAFATYQANPLNGGFIAPNTYIGDVVYWPVTSFGKRFNHIHLNILAAGGVYVNGFEFHTPLTDPVAPQIPAIGLLKNNTVQSVTTISGKYGLYVQARDLVLDDVYYLPPYKVDFSVDGGPVTTVWEFVNLPGGASDTTYVNDYHVAPPTCGDYDCRGFYIDLGFTPAGQRAFPAADGSHTVNVTVYDYSGNAANASFTWTVTGAPCVAPASVSNLAITRLDSSRVKVTWSAVAGADHYEVWSAPGEPYFAPGADCGNPAPHACTPVAGTSFPDASLDSPTTHTVYLVRAASSCGAVSNTETGRVGEFEYDVQQPGN